MVVLLIDERGWEGMWMGMRIGMGWDENHEMLGMG